jgi:hypothetical protein
MRREGNAHGYGFFVRAVRMQEKAIRSSSTSKYARCFLNAVCPISAISNLVFHEGHKMKANKVTLLLATMMMALSVNTASAAQAKLRNP